MKTLALFISMMTFWTFNSYGQSEDVNKLLDNQETRTEIFNSILNNHALMTEFIHAMNNNDHAMMMMNENNSMMGYRTDTTMQMGSGHHMPGMMGENHQGMMGENQETMHQMMNMMKENPELLRQMMGNMMDLCEKDSTQCRNLAEVMSEHPHLMMMGMQMEKDGQMESNSGTRMNMMKPGGSGMMQEHPEHHQ